MELRYITDLSKLDIEGKKVLLRLDLNVPIDDNGIIKDFTRINAILPTIKFLKEKEAKIIISTHLGRPKGKIDEKLRTKPIADAIMAKLSNSITWVSDCIGEKVKSAITRMKNSDILLLENLRFHKEEEAYEKEQNEENVKFSKMLAENADLYVDDAFACMHRAHASIVGVTKYLPSYAGLLVKKELKMLLPALEPKGITIAIIGGAKLKEKVKAVNDLAKKYSKIILGGITANVFLAATYNIGSSIISEKDDKTDYVQPAKEILKFDNIILPKKVIIAKKDFSDKKTVDIINGIPYGYLIFDVILEQEIVKEIENADCVVWCGPMGYYEKGFAKGNKLVADALAKNKNSTIIGGGETAEAAGRVNVSYVSTGGGATLELLQKGTLPGLEDLKLLEIN